MNYKGKFFGLIAIGIILISACGQNKHKVDISEVKMDLKISRFEQDLFALKKGDFKTSIEALYAKYPTFYPLYFQNLVSFGAIKDTAYLAVVQDYLNNKDINTVKHDVDSVYKDFEITKNALNTSFRYYKYHLPKAKVPNIITFMSQFNYAVVTDEENLCIGLDMFLGERYPIYSVIQFPAYKGRKQKPEYLPIAAMQGWLKDQYPMDTKDKTLLNSMVHEGKILYAMDALFPDAVDTLKMGYTMAQLKWCEDYKKDIWAGFIAENQLFETDLMKINKWLTEAPFTQGLDNTSAPQLGQYTGWQIIRSYMEKNPKITLEVLLQNNDAQLILKDSGYKP